MRQERGYFMSEIGEQIRKFINEGTGELGNIVNKLNKMFQFPVLIKSLYSEIKSYYRDEESLEDNPEIDARNQRRQMLRQAIPPEINETFATCEIQEQESEDTEGRVRHGTITGENDKKFRETEHSIVDFFPDIERLDLLLEPLLSAFKEYLQTQDEGIEIEFENNRFKKIASKIIVYLRESQNFQEVQKAVSSRLKEQVEEVYADFKDLSDDADFKLSRITAIINSIASVKPVEKASAAKAKKDKKLILQTESDKVVEENTYIAFDSNKYLSMQTSDRIYSFVLGETYCDKKTGRDVKITSAEDCLTSIRKDQHLSLNGFKYLQSLNRIIDQCINSKQNDELVRVRGGH